MQHDYHKNKAGLNRLFYYLYVSLSFWRYNFMHDNNIVIEDYLINEKTALMAGAYVQNGQQWTRVVEGKETFLVAKRPIEIINNSLLCLGSTFKAAQRSSKYLLGDCYLCPIKVNCHLGIWLFPTKSYRDDHCIWFSLEHVKDVRPLGIKRSLVYLNYHHEVEIGMRASSFKNKMEKAKQLRDVILKNEHNSVTLLLEPEKGFKIIEGTGHNPFEVK
jgi:competence protein ComK